MDQLQLFADKDDFQPKTSTHSSASSSGGSFWCVDSNDVTECETVWWVQIVAWAVVIGAVAAICIGVTYVYKAIKRRHSRATESLNPADREQNVSTVSERQMPQRNPTIASFQVMLGEGNALDALPTYDEIMMEIKLKDNVITDLEPPSYTVVNETALTPS